jgi:hypothetical protein
MRMGRRGVQLLLGHYNFSIKQGSENPATAKGGQVPYWLI